MTTEKLNTAIQLIQSGHRQSAVPVLREVIQENPANEHAWLWLYTCIDQVEQKKLCLQNVLKINPANQQAREALAALTAPASAPVASTDGMESRKESVENREESIEWQRTEPEQAERERTEPEKVERDEAQAAKAPPPQMDWDDWDEIEPVSPGPRQSRPVKAPSRFTRRRKTRGKRLSCFPILAGAVLFLMLLTVCFVFLEQMGLFTALLSWMPPATPTP